MKSTLFLMEQLIVILIFALCAAACVKIFAESHEMSVDGKDLNAALIIAESGAECFKAFSGDLEKTASVLGGVTNTGQTTVFAYYDKNLSVNAESVADYIMSITEQNIPEAPSSLIFAEVSVKKADGSEIISFTVSVGRRTG